MATPLARRPHFLSPVPETPPAVALASFAPATAGGARPLAAAARPPAPTAGHPAGSSSPAAPAPRALAAAPAEPAEQGGRDEPAAPPAPAPDIATLRREALERVAGAIETLRAQSDRLAEQARSDALEIGFQVARRILDAELRHGPEALFALVRSAVRRAGESRRIAVRLAPDDAATVQSTAGQAALEGLSASRIEVVPDASLERGDCLVDTDFGQVDGRLGTRLAELRRAVDASSEGAA